MRAEALVRRDRRRREARGRPGGLLVLLAVLGFLGTTGALWQLVVGRDLSMLVAIPVNVVLWWWLIGGAARREADRKQAVGG